MATGTSGLGFIILSAAWIHFVSAGGAYCSKTAKARAAALGLDYPGVHGAPDLSEPPPYSVQHPRALHYQHSPNNPQPPAMDYNEYYNPPREFPHFQPTGYGSHSPTQSYLLSKLSGGGPQYNRKSNFEQVKHDGPLPQKQPPDLAVYRASESLKYPLPFVDNWHGVAPSAFVLNGDGIGGVNGLPLPHSPGYGVYYLVYPVGAGSKPGVVYAMDTRGSLPGYNAWPMYGKSNKKPTNPSYPSHLGRRE